jgi:acetyltransferase-like isoleucine patch superfamily enzyme
MAYFTQDQLLQLRFKLLGSNVKISDKASIYDCNQIEIGNNSRIDDFCVISGKLKIGRNVHITPFCLISGGMPGITIEDFSTLAYGVKVFSQSDDYSGKSMVNSTIPEYFKKEIMRSVLIERQSIIGAGSIIMPGVTVAVGSSIGANSLVLKSTNPWDVCVGSPAKKIKERKKELLALEKEYLKKDE